MECFLISSCGKVEPGVIRNLNFDLSFFREEKLFCSSVMYCFVIIS